MSSKYSLPSAPLLLLVSDRTRYGDRSLEDILVIGVLSARFDARADRRWDTRRPGRESAGRAC